MTLGYRRNDMVLKFRVHKLELGLWQQQYRMHGLVFDECLLIKSTPVVSVVCIRMMMTDATVVVRNEKNSPDARASEE